MLRSARAGFLFDMGKRDEAITEMQDIVKQKAPLDDLVKIKVGLARMQSVVGNQVAARALVEDVLAEKSDYVEALKLKAGGLILDDSRAEAITFGRRKSIGSFINAMSGDITTVMPCSISAGNW